MAELYFDREHNTVVCSGHWNTSTVAALETLQPKIMAEQLAKPHIDASGIASIDSAGALFLADLFEKLKTVSSGIGQFRQNDHVKRMLNLINDTLSAQPAKKFEGKQPSALSTLGRECYEKCRQIFGVMVLVGELVFNFITACFNWRHFRVHSVINIIEHAGFRALPIVGLLSFLIGVVLAYQMGIKLEEYGASSYVVYLCGVSIEREFGPLITAIIIAGRTGSSFTAELGSMKVNEEMDAITTMGLSNIELLVMPRIMGMFLVFPLMIFWADVYGMLGAMFMSKLMLNLNYGTFLGQLQSQVGVREFLLGLYKSPVFAILIALVGCFQGFQVKGSADSIGLLTTKSVVQAIFLIIIADAFFSVVYSWFGL